MTTKTEELKIGMYARYTVTNDDTLEYPMWAKIRTIQSNSIWGDVILRGSWGTDQVYSTEPYEGGGHCIEFFPAGEPPDQFYVDQAKQALLEGT